VVHDVVVRNVMVHVRLGGDRGRHAGLDCDLLERDFVERHELERDVVEWHELERHELEWHELERHELERLVVECQRLELTR
jgi:hypothetical protein